MPVVGFSRRALLLTGVGASVGMVTAWGDAARAAPPLPAVARRNAMIFLDAMMDAHSQAGVLRLPQSYADEVGLYATGFTYDAALTILAYLADDRPESGDRAHRLGEALYYAQQHDPQYSDGRLRQAYNVGPYTRAGVEQADGFVREDGSVNIGGAFGFTASGTGETAWAGLAFCALYQRGGDGRMIGAAVRLGEWVVDTCRSAGPLGGFTAGVDRDGDARAQVSTASNADLVAFFGRLAALTGDRRWLTHRDDAARFVGRMFSAPRQMFHSGSADGATIDRQHLVLEAQTHSWLALSELNHIGVLDTVARQLVVTDTASRPHSGLTGNQRVTGVTVSATSRTVDPTKEIEPGLPLPNPDAVWLEGTAQYATAVRFSPLGELTATRLLDAVTEAQAQLGGRQHVGDVPLPTGAGLVAASSPLHAGYVDSGYYSAKHVAATAWLALASAGVNPLSPAGMPHQPAQPRFDSPFGTLG